MFSTLYKWVEGSATGLSLPQTNASQYTFIVTIKPPNKAGQLKSCTNRGANTNNNTVSTILTPCHTAKLKVAATALMEAAGDFKPLANKAAGMTTDNAP
jgi:hypothetical protein